MSLDWATPRKRFQSDRSRAVELKDSVTTPSQAAARSETRDWIRLAMELLGDDDRRMILLRVIEERSFPEAATLLGIAEDAARMRFNRALSRLARVVKSLKKGGLGDLLEAGA